MVESEVGGRRAGTEEGAMVMGVALNRLRRRHRRDPSMLRQVLTGGAGYGEQGKEGRQFGTKKAPSARSLAAARKMLTGETEIPDVRATSFFHTGEAGILSGIYSRYGGTGRPKFARNMVNIANVARSGDPDKPGRGTVLRV